MNLQYLQPRYVESLSEDALLQSLAEYREALATLQRSREVQVAALEEQLTQAIALLEREMQRRHRVERL